MKISTVAAGLSSRLWPRVYSSSPESPELEPLSYHTSQSGGPFSSSLCTKIAVPHGLPSKGSKFEINVQQNGQAGCPDDLSITLTVILCHSRFL